MLELRQLRSPDLSMAVQYVSSYFEHDGLVFDRAVGAAIGQLLADETLGRFWSVDSQGDSIGYVVLTFGFDHEFGGRIGLITDLFLVEAARGHGLGGQVLSLVLKKAEELGLKAIELYVLDHNQRARDFYSRNGFETTPGRSPLFKKL
jgi:ribosomal protein S18 acetylase RimI-like enzyme